MEGRKRGETCFSLGRDEFLTLQENSNSLVSGYWHLFLLRKKIFYFLQYHPPALKTLTILNKNTVKLANQTLSWTQKTLFLCHWLLLLGFDGMDRDTGGSRAEL